MNSYIGNGAPWDLNTNNGGAYVLSPYTHVGDEGRWYEGTADAIYQNVRFIDGFDPEYVVVLSGDHIYKMDYSAMIQFHKDNDADATIAVMPVPEEEVNRFGVIAGEEVAPKVWRINALVEKPPVEEAPTNLAIFGRYLLSPRVMELLEDAQPGAGGEIQLTDALDAVLCEEEMYALVIDPDEGYDVGTIESWHEANVAMMARRGK